MGICWFFVFLLLLFVFSFISYSTRNTHTNRFEWVGTIISNWWHQFTQVKESAESRKTVFKINDKYPSAMGPHRCMQKQQQQTNKKNSRCQPTFAKIYIGHLPRAHSTCILERWAASVDSTLFHRARWQQIHTYIHICIYVYIYIHLLLLQPFQFLLHIFIINKAIKSCSGDTNLRDEWVSVHIHTTYVGKTWTTWTTWPMCCEMCPWTGVWVGLLPILLIDHKIIT